MSIFEKENTIEKMLEEAQTTDKKITVILENNIFYTGKVSRVLPFENSKLVVMKDLAEKESYEVVIDIFKIIAIEQRVK